MFAHGRGLALTPERAYRAWRSHAGTVGGGWPTFDLDGVNGDRTFAALKRAECRLRLEDAQHLAACPADAARLQGHAEDLGLGLSREDAVRIWADHSAAAGCAWKTVDPASVDDVLRPYGSDKPGP